jgi:uncharacterized protein YoaH (UPF0181 family)
MRLAEILDLKGLMTYQAKAAVCSEIRTKHSTQSSTMYNFLIVKPGGTWRKR